MASDEELGKVRLELIQYATRCKVLEGKMEKVIGCVMGAAKCGYISEEQRHAFLFALEELTGEHRGVIQIMIDQVPRKGEAKHARDNGTGESERDNQFGSYMGYGPNVDRDQPADDPDTWHL